MLVITTVLTWNKSQFKWYLFVCSMLQSSYLLVAPRLANPLYCMYTISWPVKWFIERLSQYKAPGRLSPCPPGIPTYRHAFLFWACCCSKAICFCKIWCSSSFFAASRFEMCWVLFCCLNYCSIFKSIWNICCERESNSRFNWAKETRPPSAIVKRKWQF